MVVSPHRLTKISIDTNAIKQNIKHELQRRSSQKEIFAVVKANGYGHGIMDVAHIAQEAGVSGFCVATIDEAVALRQSGLNEPILVLGVVDPTYLELASKHHISLTVPNIEWLETVAEQTFTEPLALHIAIDTGMGRIGFLSESELTRALSLIETNSSLVWEGIFTHFATADEEDTTYFEEQLRRFKAYLATLPKLPRYVHTSNSATTLWHEEVGNMVRLGIAMYGMNPSGNVLDAPYELQPALRLVSTLTQVKEVPKHSFIGYGATYETSQNEWIGTVPIGYADGYLRQMQGFYVLVNGEPCEIVGRVCMDQLMIRLPEQVAIGSEVVLIGEQGSAKITVEDIAAHLNTINYEVVCLLSERIPREYI